MGWGRTFLLGDIGNRLDIEDIENDVANMKKRFSRDLASSDESFQKVAAEMRLYLATVIRLLVTKGVVTNDEIRSMVYAIDREDGFLDGKYDGKLQP